MIYLDYNATAPLKPAVREAIYSALDVAGNPSSVHAAGREVRRIVETAREKIAAFIDAKPSQVIFTSGGTESNNCALLQKSEEARFCSAIEHPSVLENVVKANHLAVKADGLVDLVYLENILKNAPAKSLVSVMMVNSETGIIQPVDEIIQIANKYSHIVHIDAVQALGRLPISFTKSGISLMSISAHKIGGPQGVGALIVADNIVPQALLRGGGQERNIRSGTENVAGICGFGRAIELAHDDLQRMPLLEEWRNKLQSELKDIAQNNVVVIGENSPRVANTLNIALRGMSSETQVMSMDLAGVAVSAGSACSSGKVNKSPVLEAMGYGPEISGSALRFSFGWKSVATDVDKVVNAWRVLYKRTQ